MDRAEKLKNHLANADNKKKPSAVGANGKVANGGGKGGVSLSTMGGILLTDACVTA